ncbi:Short-chain dehydrogenase [Geodermatophilus obscurus]|uniref:Short-chain dehydrogenase n=1 Tax=Geodermatophilus obscurus TaxID=1861 RepID=A0A1M7T750_9ACTN|nr:SDR family oxidoreductase [Geodermatophilus obscurus]SHN66553.1 Short-chain dehydrogenase [Geodermatophilus obscurus]
MADTRPVRDQVVVVLGASSGIGRATALEFARQGCTRIVVASRGEEALGTLVEELTRKGAEAVAVPTDITDQAAVRALVDAAEARFGRIDTFVTVPGVGIWGSVKQIDLDEFRRVTEVNYLGHVATAQAAVPALERAGGGVLIGIGSVEGYRSIPLHAPYSASKFALRAFYDALRMELAEEGSPVEVSQILPAGIATPFFEHARTKLGSMPKPPPPVYAPELVAEAVVRASVHPRREIPVGDAALGFIAGQRFSPALTDAVLSLTGRQLQTTDRPDDGTDILDSPTPGPGRVRGAFADQVLTTSPVTRVAGVVARPGELLLRAIKRR